MQVMKVPITFSDRLLGEQCVVLSETDGDFVLRRAGGLLASQGVTQVVQGADIGAEAGCTELRAYSTSSRCGAGINAGTTICGPGCNVV